MIFPSHRHVALGQGPHAFYPPLDPGAQLLVPRGLWELLVGWMGGWKEDKKGGRKTCVPGGPAPPAGAILTPIPTSLPTVLLQRLSHF